MISREKLATFCQWFKRKSFVICCGIAPVILLSALLATSNFGCNVIVNGEIIGTAPSSEYVNDLINSINDELSPYLGGSNAVTVEPTTTPKLLIGKGFTDTQILSERLKKYCPYLEKAYTVKSNGKTVVGFKTKNERKAVYDAFIDKMTSGSTSYEILDKITFEYELVPFGLIKKGTSAAKMLERTYKFNDTVKINKDCTLSDILAAYCITESSFELLNPNYKDGKESTVKISSTIPYIRVVSSQTYTENTVVKYSTKYEMDETIYEGESKLKKSGKDGLRTTTKTIYAVNGNDVYVDASEPEYTEATTEVVLIGTKESPAGKSTGNISKPCKGVLTSRFGSRNGRQHKGIDISGKENSDIYSADGGTVTFADWDDSGYGYMIKIDHGNGYSTLYAHCNKLYVSEGDKVKQGDVIAALGNTGRSTGPHIHFEVISNESGVSLDPLKFFSLDEIS